MARMALAALIDETKRRNGWSDVNIADRSRRPGQKRPPLTKSDVSNYRTLGMPRLSPAKLIALADGLGLPAYKVAIAALADHGIVMPLGVETPEDAIMHDHTLAVQTRDALLAILQAERARPQPPPRKRSRTDG